MKVFQRMLETNVKKLLHPEAIGAEIIEEHLKRLGISLTKVQKADLRDQLRRSEWEGLALDIEDDQVPVDLHKKEDGSITFHITDATNILENIVSQFEAQIERAIPKIATNVAGVLHRQLHRQANKALAIRRKHRDGFQRRLARRWRKPLDLLEMIITIAAEAGADFNNEWHRKAARKQDFRFEALIGLHARACQIAWEVLALLGSGFADGAHARWRSLHEIAVVALFISQHDNDLAERYLLHDAIESYKAAIQYQKHAPSLGYDLLAEEELNVLRHTRDVLVDRFGDAYDQDYGWAVVALQAKRATIADIEKAAGLEHFRPFYRMASRNVHANAEGIYAKLGLCRNGPDYLLAGASNFGLADPGHGTAIAILQITTALLCSKVSLDNLVIGHVLAMLTDECGQTFLEVQMAMEEEVSSVKRE